MARVDHSMRCRRTAGRKESTGAGSSGSFSLGSALDRLLPSPAAGPTDLTDELLRDDGVDASPLSTPTRRSARLLRKSEGPRLTSPSKPAADTVGRLELPLDVDSPSLKCPAPTPIRGPEPSLSLCFPRTPATLTKTRAADSDSPTPVLLRRAARTPMPVAQPRDGIPLHGASCALPGVQLPSGETNSPISPLASIGPRVRPSRASRRMSLAPSKLLKRTAAVKICKGPVVGAFGSRKSAPGFKTRPRSGSSSKLATQRRSLPASSAKAKAILSAAGSLPGYMVSTKSAAARICAQRASAEPARMSSVSRNPMELTVPVTPDFATTRRRQLRADLDAPLTTEEMALERSLQAAKDEHDSHQRALSRVLNARCAAPAHRNPTVPTAPRLSGLGAPRAPAYDSYVGVAESLANYDFRSSRAASAAPPRKSPAEVHAPRLTTESRASGRRSLAKTTEELELERIRSHKWKAQPMPDYSRLASRGVATVSRRSLTQPREFHFSTTERAQQHATRPATASGRPATSRQDRGLGRVGGVAFGASTKDAGARLKAEASCPHAMAVERKASRVALGEKFNSLNIKEAWGLQ